MMHAAVPCAPGGCRFGVLPRLNRHWHGASRRLPIDAGLYELATSRHAASAAAIRRRGRALVAWLAAAISRGQELHLRHDLPRGLAEMLAGIWKKQPNVHPKPEPVSEAVLPTVQARAAGRPGWGGGRVPWQLMQNMWHLPWQLSMSRFLLQAVVAAHRGALHSFVLYLGPPPAHGVPGPIDAALLEGFASLQTLFIRWG